MDSINLRIFKENMRDSYKLLPKKIIKLLYGDIGFRKKLGYKPPVNANHAFDNRLNLKEVGDPKSTT